MNKQVRIKICGLKDTDTIQAMDGLPIHEIGFIFAPSKRQVSNEIAAKLVNAAHKLATANQARPRTVGVFVNASERQLLETLAEAPLDVVQLHGDESPELCSRIRSGGHNVKVWKVFSIRNSSEQQDLEIDAMERLRPFADSVDAILIDAPGGGTGRAFDWTAIRQYMDAAHQFSLPLYVAGGLNADNVGQLLSSYSPDGIDVSSGVETDGHKDIDKIKLFVRRVMEA